VELSGTVIRTSFWFLDGCPGRTYLGSPMSYLENGSTLRAMFRLMPPTRHDADPTRSEVVTYIRDKLRSRSCAPCVRFDAEHKERCIDIRSDPSPVARL
jgi:hypothetical protein